MTLTASLSLRPFILLSVAFVVCGCIAQGATQSATVDGVRPVAKAVQQLEKIYNVPITYEDIRYVHESEMKIDQQGRSIIKGGSISFDYEAPPSDASLEARKAQAASAIAEVLRSYNASRGAEIFTVVATSGQLSVVPLQSTDTSGRLEKLQPLLDTPISISPGQRTGYQLVEEISRSLSVTTGRAIGTGTIPISAFRPHTTTITASNEPARSVLDRLFKEIPVGYESKPNKAGGTHLIRSNLSWQVWCGPDKNPECSINIHIVAPEGRATTDLERDPPGVIRPEDK